MLSRQDSEFIHFFKNICILGGLAACAQKKKRCSAARAHVAEPPPRFWQVHRRRRLPLSAT